MSFFLLVTGTVIVAWIGVSGLFLALKMVRARLRRRAIRRILDSMGPVTSHARTTRFGD